MEHLLKVEFKRKQKVPRFCARSLRLRNRRHEGPQELRQVSRTSTAG